MFNRERFSMNFKMLRTSYSLSIPTANKLLHLKSTSTIHYWETQKNIPSADMLIHIVDLFGVSADWLLGRSSAPYTDESVLAAEEALTADCNETECKWQRMVTEKVIASEYDNIANRKKQYSLSVRANIVFLLRKTILENTEFAVTNIKQHNLDNAKLSDEAELLHSLMFKKSRVPTYDIEAMINQ